MKILDSNWLGCVNRLDSNWLSLFSGPQHVKRCPSFLLCWRLKSTTILCLIRIGVDSERDEVGVYEYLGSGRTLSQKLLVYTLQ